MGLPFDPGVPTSLLVGVTGHRQLDPVAIPELRAQLSAFFGALQARYPRLPLLLLSPLAEGGDQLTTEVALQLGIRVVAPLPLPVDLYREDFEHGDARACFERQLQQAQVLVLPMAEGASHESAARPGPVRDRQYADAGQFVSSHCQVLLALWDGDEEAGVGGTSEIVRFHLRGDMTGRSVPSRASLAMLGLEEQSLVYWIPTPRAGAPRAVGMPRWLTVNDRVVSSATMPAAFDRMFRQQSGFNLDSGRYAREIARDVDLGAEARECPIARLFVVADWLAGTYQRRVEWVLRATYVLAAATGFAFILYDNGPSQDAMIYVYLALFSAGIGLAVMTRRRDWHRKYLDYRALAEGLRVQSYWRRAGIVDLQDTTFPHENFMLEQDIDLGWIRNVMRGARLVGLAQPAACSTGELDAVIRQWIGNDGDGGQLGYFSRTAERRSRQHRRAGVLAKTCLGLGIAISIMLALLAAQLDNDTKDIAILVMGLLSVSAAVHEAYSYKKADKELIKQYRFMQRIYAGARLRLDASATPRERRRILHTLGEAALAEHAEWTLMQRERPLDHTRLV